ncbi:MAG: DUF1565 domain-containing protein, partial [Gammaproteobacteria bacterium]|nr:DUF1565 domain-containing protein [Gammaproteobacteria bacterium]
TQYNWGVEARNSAGTVEDSGYSFTTLALEEDETVLLYVDDNGPSDPGPDDPDLSDPQEDGSSDHPFDSIQEAIDAARDGQIVTVMPGTYKECLNLQGKSILLTSLYDDPNALGAIGQTVIDCHQAGPVVTFASGEDANCILSGFTITGGKAESGGAILCYDSNPTVSHCMIVGNRATHYNGGGIDCYQSAARFINCTVSGNYAQHGGGGIHCEDSNAVFCNSIIWDNTPDQILVSSGAAPDVQYCNVQGGFSGAGNLDTDPYFCIPGYWADPCDPSIIVPPDTADALWIGGDYHLQSQGGRYDAHSEMWVQDTQHSP